VQQNQLVPEESRTRKICIGDSTALQTGKAEAKTRREEPWRADSNELGNETSPSRPKPLDPALHHSQRTQVRIVAACRTEDEKELRRTHKHQSEELRD
jgi:hypothetical protein